MMKKEDHTPEQPEITEKFKEQYLEILEEVFEEEFGRGYVFTLHGGEAGDLFVGVKATEVQVDARTLIYLEEKIKRKLHHTDLGKVIMNSQTHDSQYGEVGYLIETFPRYFIQEYVDGIEPEDIDDGLVKK